MGLVGALIALGVGYALAAWVMFPAPPDSGEQVQVPSLIGLTLDSAREALAARHLLLGDTMLIASDSAAGTIVAQSTLAEQDLLPGARVDVGIARPERTVTVPPVLGLGQAAAQALLAQAGLSADPQTKPDSVLAGRVLDVQPSVGSTLQPPGPVVLVVSSGPAALDTLLVGVDSGTVVPGDTGAAAAQSGPPGSGASASAPGAPDSARARVTPRPAAPQRRDTGAAAPDTGADRRGRGRLAGRASPGMS